MRRSLLLLASAAALVGASAGPAAAAERPPVHCDPMACPDPVAMVKECLYTASFTTDPNTGLPVLACRLSPR